GIVSRGRKTVMIKLSGRSMQVLAGVSEIGPYAAVELLMPGGSVIAVLLWLYRRYKRPPA
ncbi:MAG: hypothetical protein JWO52_7106, partial [Gammaproteobacteria bacterium]|nr:hypothetical protein [Gammaproteobacteria bacterium]